MVWPMEQGPGLVDEAEPGSARVDSQVTVFEPIINRCVLTPLVFERGLARGRANPSCFEGGLARVLI